MVTLNRVTESTSPFFLTNKICNILLFSTNFKTKWFIKNVTMKFLIHSHKN